MSNDNSKNNANDRIILRYSKLGNGTTESRRDNINTVVQNNQKQKASDK